MSITKESFGRAGGREAALYTISRAGVALKVTDFGACIVSIFAPDRNGETADVALGFDTAAGYTDNSCFLGALIGPSANRIGGGRFVIDGEAWQLPINENTNNLHTDFLNGSHKRIWDTELRGDAVRFTLRLGDGEFGMPGNRVMEVTYAVTDSAAVQLSYRVSSDRRTLVNMTNHCYFNLAGENAGNAEEQVMQLFCDSYCPVEPDSIPTGEIAPVEGTPLDFRAPKAIGRDIGADFRQLKLVGGYDHNFVINGWENDGMLRRAAAVHDPASGRAMDVYTTLPGIQFYSGNFLKEGNGKGGRSYAAREGFCLETQYFPDSMNHDNFAHPVFGADTEYSSVTEYRFYTV